MDLNEHYTIKWHKHEMETCNHNWNLKLRIT